MAASEPPGDRQFIAAEHVERCALCGSPEFVVIDERARVVVCTACGHRFVSPRPSQAEIAAAYSDPHQYDHWLAEQAGRQAMWRRRLHLVRRFTNGPRLLDVGAGVGTFLALAREEAGWQVAGTEVSDSAAAIARDRHGIELSLGQLDQLDLPTAGFDVVTLWHVLEHVPDPAQTLATCRRLLAPGGLLVVAVPNDGGAAFAARRAKHLASRALGRLESLPPRYEALHPGMEIHLSHFNPNSLHRLLSGTGFEVMHLGVDDQYPERSWQQASMVGFARLVRAMTRLNIGSALVAIGRLVEQ